jgi:hypothetical protein
MRAFWRSSLSIPFSLLLFCQFGCKEVGRDQVDPLQEAFARKRTCAEFGRARLADDKKSTPRPFTELVSAEWCYSTTLHTCIYSSEIYFRALDGEVKQAFATIDLLTNHEILGFGATLNPSADTVEGYQEKRQELFSKCQE